MSSLRFTKRMGAIHSPPPSLARIGRASDGGSERMASGPLFQGIRRMGREKTD